MKRWGEVPLLPLGEHEEPLKYLLERVGGQVIAWAHWNPGPAPRGWATVGFEFHQGARLLLLACPAQGGPWAYRLAARYLPPQQIWTKRMTSHFGSGRGPTDPAPDAIQRQIEGQLIVGMWHAREPNLHGGAELMLDFSGGDGARINALPHRQTPLATEIEVQMVRRRVIVTGP